MQNKIVLITGAGFSAPAKLPLQNEILKEMTASPINSIMDLGIETESEKFLHAYINVGIYLLINYVDAKHKTWYDEYKLLERQLLKDEAINCFLAQADVDFANYENINEIKNKVKNMIVGKDKHYSDLVIFKEKIRRLLEIAKLEINLEDVFTSFDKSIITREYLKDYSYGKIDEIRHSIMRLFTYYFGKKTQDHNYQTDDYNKTLDFIKTHKKDITIITTNWDTILEGYLKRNNITYDLGLNDIYYKFDDVAKNPRLSSKAIKLIKVHGSINWFRCLNCGTLSIIEKSEYSKYLFDDKSEEICISCKTKSHENEVLLQPEIITPTMIKSIDNQLYKNLWKTARNELMKADKIIFIGYSFPVADYEFRHLLQKSIPNTAKIDVVLYKYDDPNLIQNGNEYLKQLLPEKRFKDAFHQNKIDFDYEGFKDYFGKYID